MHPDLNKWLGDVWSRRKAIFDGYTQTGRAINAEPIDSHRGVGRVYRLYAAADGGGKGDGSTAAVPDFLAAIAGLVEKRQAKCVIQSNGFWSVSVGELQRLAGGEEIVWRWQPANSDDSGMYLISQSVILNSFIHVRHATNFGQVDQRIYLNLGPRGRGAAFADIVNAVYNIKGFCSAKASCPGGSDRNDTGLLYLTDETAVAAALRFLQTFQKDRPEAFRPGLPRLTSPVEGLTGVGRGMEPPHYAVIRQGGNYYKLSSGMSFGLYRSALIFMALDRTYWTRPGQNDAQRCAAFKRRAAKYFRAGGIDPDNPSVQVNPDDLADYKT